jgi:DNA-binding protein YbaB
MFNPLKGLGDLAKIQQVQKALQQEEITVEKNGVRIVMRGDQQLKSIEIDGIVENRIAEAINEAVKKTQEHAARKLLEMSRE